MQSVERSVQNGVEGGLSGDCGWATNNNAAESHQTIGDEVRVSHDVAWFGGFC